jgi:hypothetical protein
LVLHFCIIYTLGVIAFWLGMYFRALVVLVLTLLLLPLMARKRDQWMQRPRYGKSVAIFMGIAGFVSVFFARPKLIGIAKLANFAMAFGFAFVFPYIRSLLRKKYTSAVPAVTAREA